MASKSIYLEGDLLELASGSVTYNEDGSITRVTSAGVTIVTTYGVNTDGQATKTKVFGAPINKTVTTTYSETGSTTVIT